MAESRPYSLPNTQGRYVTVTVTNQSGEVYRINDDGTRTIYADYFVENGNTVLEASPVFSSEEFQKNLAQNSQGYNRTISNSILQANGQTNSQPDPNQPGAPGGSTPTNPNTPTDQQTNKPVAQRLTYPSDMSGKQDRIKFTAYTYTSNISSRIGGNFGELNPVQFNSIGSSVFLAIQSSITDQNAVGWEPDTLNPIEVEAAKLSATLITSPAKDIAATAGKYIGKVVQKAAQHEESIRAYVVGQAIGVNNLQSRLLGQVLNPNLELLFTGPQLRPFSFTFKLSPRSGPEAKEVKDIIKYFKKNMAVVKGSDAVFLKTPNVFKIEYQYGNEKGEHPGLNLIKMCALTNCSVDYTPNGTYMTYSDGTMVSYNLNLQFQELTPIYQEDYDKFDYGDKTTIKNPTIGA
ncbi:MAG: hypothetical protein FJ368_07260 [Pelagibacterales bacterium]|nr:hypothetical protein [Pelagibacterales bacterium]